MDVDVKKPEIPLQRSILQMIAAVVGSGVVTLAAWWVLKQTSLPAFNTSMVTRALSTAGTVLVLVVTGLVVWYGWRRQANPQANGRALPALTHTVAYLAPAGLVFTTLAIPLSATTLYLDGIQVDQGFRSQFLTRMADTAQNADMNYWDMPTYYPMGWFWLGGRLANVLGVPGWEVFQPWAIVSLAMAGSLLVPVWQRLTGSLPIATAIALVTTAVTIVIAGDEPYAAVVAMMGPAAVFMARRALTTSWTSAVALILILGVSATFYTLFTGLIALTVVIFAFILALTKPRGLRPLWRLLVIGVGAILIALLSWGPYLWQVLQGAPTNSTAMHYLPETGTQVPLPFLSLSVVGVLCLAGVVFLIAKADIPDVRFMSFATLTFYGWVLLSMLATLAGTTLLGFRVEVLITLQLATAGVLALAWVRRVGVYRLYPQGWSQQTNKVVSAVVVVVLLAGGVLYAQSIPARHESAIDEAYSNTDGHGQRADQFPPDTARHYAAINEEIASHGFEPSETVILTDENRLLSYFPYFGFNAHTSHYANPLGQFEERNEQIREWADGSYDQLSDPADFAAALSDTPWREPDVFIFRGTLDEDSPEWKLHISEDIYPSQPNVRYVGLLFNSEVFRDPDLWHLKEVGPYVVATRNDS